MSNISSDTVFHFTTWDNLISILENGFYPRFSLERFCFKKDEVEEVAFPMVSFCDIPLSQIKKHVKRYGSYGLGLTKQWAITKGMNPVLYLKENSFLARSIEGSFESFELFTDLYQTIRATLKEISIISKDYPKKDLVKLEKKINVMKKQLDLIDLAISSQAKTWMYMKQYEECSLKKGERKKKVRFYDEREWRYIPNLESYLTNLEKLNIPAGLMSKNDFKDSYRKPKANTILESAKLSFNPKVIKYIIVKKEEEILEMINKLERIKGNKYPANVIKILTSRILTYEQIDKDF